jgi:demethylmenaquinone methyltransferase/2-methoxy-6-polyprenyl-1,4-benzoquinol methylase
MSVERREPGSGSRQPDKSPAKISGMFDAIAGRYDLLNLVLSGGMDRYWRRCAISSLKLTGKERLLDVCTGTADVAIGSALRAKGAARVVGVDFSGAMLTHGLDKRTHRVRFFFFFFFFFGYKRDLPSHEL